MQVKKFEARTMKEALEMVKTQLGPDAIILSARDNKRFGLVGEGSVEITAAVSEMTLQKKKFAEARIKAQDREAFSKSPARAQKEIIEKMVSKHLERHQEKEQTKQTIKRLAASTRYADIDDEIEMAQDEMHLNPNNSKTRQEAQKYWMEMQAEVESQLRTQPNNSKKNEVNTGTAQNYKSTTAVRSPTSSKAQSVEAGPGATTAGVNKSAATFASSNSNELGPVSQVQVLQKELDSLRQVLAEFQKIPQNISTVQKNGGYPGSDYGLSYDVSWLYEKLTQEGVEAATVASLLSEAQNELTPVRLRSRPVLEGMVAKKFLDKIRIAPQADIEKVHIFVGPAGCGKTSSIVKMASHLILKEKKRIAIVSTDSFKVGAAEQMKIFAQILNVPFVVIRDSAEWSYIFKHMQAIDHVLVDYPGLSLKNFEEIELMKGILPPMHEQVRTHLVVSSKSRDRDLFEIAKRYGQIHFDDLIFTGLDESITYGNIYNLMDRCHVPLFAFGIGSRVPEDLEFATRERLLDLIFKITQQRAVEKVAHGEQK